MLIEDIDRFINDHYRMSGKDVIIAFEMAATHSLYLDGKRVDPSTFGKFLSRASVGKILTAYKESKQSSNARPQCYNPMQLREAPVKKITPQEAHDLILKICKAEGELPLALPYTIAYEYLLANGQVKQVGDEKVDVRKFKLLGKAMQIPVSAKRQAAEKWYTDNVLNN